MKLYLRNKLLFTSVKISDNSREIEISGVIVDTGSASTIFSAQAVLEIGIMPFPDDKVRIVRGVGGAEAVFSRKVDSISLGNYTLRDFEIEVGGMDYGFTINGILGLDFLQASGAKIDLENLNIDFTR